MSKINKSYRDFYTYSLIKTLYLKGKSYLDTFSPFVLNSLKNDCQNMQALIDKIKATFGLNIPILTLKNIIKKLKKDGFIEFDSNFENIILTDKGKKGFFDYIEDSNSVYSELEGLFKDISVYLEQKLKVKVDFGNIYKFLENIINDNFAFFVSHFNPNYDEDVKQNNKPLNGLNNEIKSCLSEFVINELNLKTKNYEVLKKISYGALLSSVLTNDSVIDESNKYNFNNLIVYLDSNIVLSLLGGHGDDLQKSNTQLIDLMKKRGIKINIFSFTLDEIINVLEGYFREKGKYIKGYYVDSIYQNFKNKGYNDSKIYKLIAEFETIVQDKYGISIDNNISIKKLSFDIDLYDIEELKGKGDKSKVHDIGAIESIKSYRKQSSPRYIELAKYIFLSYDRKLFLADCKVNDKSLSGKIPHIISPEYFSNYLWIKKPDWENNLPIAMIFSSVHSHGLIDKNIWNKFYVTVSDMSSKGEITKEDYMHLISNNEFKNELSDIKEENEINKDLVIKGVKEAKKEIEKKTYNKLQIEFEDNLEKGISDNEQDLRMKIIANIKNIRKKHANIVTILIKFFLYTAFIAIMYFFVYKKLLINILTSRWGEYEGTITFILMVIGTFGSFFNIPKFPTQVINNYIFKKLVDKDIDNLLTTNNANN